MKSILLSTLFAVAVAVPFSVAADEQNAALDTAKAYVEALRTHNYPAMVELAPKPLVKVMGGKDKMIAALKADPSMDDVAIESVSFPDDIAKVEATDAVLYLIKAETTALYKRKTRILLHSYYIVFRFKDQSNWNVLDGSQNSESKLKKLFRGLPQPLHLPQVTADAVQEDTPKTAAP